MVSGLGSEFPPPPSLRSIGPVLRDVREWNGQSITAAAQAIGVTRLTYDMWEKDALVPNDDKADAIVRDTSLSLSEVLTSWAGSAERWATTSATGSGVRVRR